MGFFKKFMKSSDDENKDLKKDNVITNSSNHSEKPKDSMKREDSNVMADNSASNSSEETKEPERKTENLQENTDSSNSSDNDLIINSAENFRYLSDLMANGGENIILDSHIKMADDEIKDFKKGITISDDIAIDGKDFIIDANGKSSIFDIQSGNIIFKNIKFRNAFFKKAGSAIRNSDASITFINCEFTNCYSKKEGGAIYNASGNLKFDNCTFKNNGCERDGGTIYNVDGELTLENCKFCGNSSKWYGGAICNKKGIVKSSDSKFIENSSLRTGSSLWNGFYMELIDNEFASKSDKENAAIIYQENEDSILEISGTNLISNHETIIHLNDGNSNLSSSKLDMKDNSGSGYIIFNENAYLGIRKTKFNSSNEKCIYNNSTVKISKEENIEKLIESTETSQIKYYYESLPNDWKGFTFFEEEYLNKDLKKIRLEFDITIHDTEQNFYEGGIELNRDGLEIDGNGHVIDGSNLSRIFLITADNITLKNIIFKNGKYWKNYLDDEYCGGGAIDVQHYCTVTLINCQFIDNTSKNSAGAINNNGTIESLTDCKFIDNSADLNGGAIINRVNSMNLSGCEFDKNNSNGNGGSIYNVNNSLNMKKCRFKENTSENNGGAIYTEFVELLSLDEYCLFDENQSKEGGAVYMNKGSMDFKNTTFQNNQSAKGDGGAIYFKNCKNFNVENCIFNDNTSNHDGGAIFSFFVEDSYNIANCKFVNNSTKFGAGGAIYNHLSGFNERTTIKNTIFNKNNSNSGGAISSRGYLKLLYCDFEDNIGGAIINESRLNVFNCNFINNPNVNIFSKKNEGDIWNGTGGVIAFKNCTFKSDYQYVMSNRSKINIGEGNNFEKHHSFLKDENAEYLYQDGFEGY